MHIILNDRIFFVVVCRVWSSVLMCQMDFPGLCWKASCTLFTVLTSVGSLPVPSYVRHSLPISFNHSTSAYWTFFTFKALMFPHLSHWSQLPVPQHPSMYLVHWWYSAFLFPPLWIFFKNKTHWFFNNSFTWCFVCAE